MAGENTRPGGVSLPETRVQGVADPGPLLPGAAPGAGQAERQAAAALGALSQRLGDMAVVAADREGTLAGFDPEFRPREGRSRTARAFNAAGAASYLQRLEIDLNTGLDARALEHRNDPAALGASFDAFRQELLASEAFQQPEMRQGFETLFAQKRLHYEQQAARDEIRRQEAEALATAQIWAENELTALGRAARNLGIGSPDGEAALAGLMSGYEAKVAEHQAAGVLSPAQGAAFIQSAQSTAAYERVVGGFDRAQGLSAMQDFRDRFAAGVAANDPAFALLDTGMVDSLTARMDRDIDGETARIERAAAQARAEQDRAASQAAAAFTAQFRIGVLNGERGISDWEDAVARGAFGDDPNTALTVYREVLAGEEDMRERTARAAILTQGPLDPTDSAHRQAVDERFADAGGLDLVRAGDPDGRAMLEQATKQWNVVPEAAASLLRVQATAGTPEQQIAALDTMARLYEIAPASAGREFSGDALNDAILYARRAAAGVPPADALASVMTARAARRDGGLETLRDAGARLAGDMTGEDIRRRMPGRLGFGGGAIAAARGEENFRQFFADAYAMHGNADDAAAQAAAQMQRIYGPTEIMGRTVTRPSGGGAQGPLQTIEETRPGQALMPYPPEQYYAVRGVDNGWMRDQLLDGAREATGRDDLELENVALTADAQTAREAQAGMAPSYRVTVTRPDGVLEQVPGRFVFDNAKAREQAAAREAEIVARARSIRDYQQSTPPQLQVMP